MACDGKGRDWSYAATSPETPRMAGKLPETRKRHKIIPL